MKHQYQKGKSISKTRSRSEVESKLIKTASENQYTDFFNIYSAENETWLFQELFSLVITEQLKQMLWNLHRCSMSWWIDI